MSSPIRVSKNGSGEQFLVPALANRHGLIAGATGTGKTVTLQSLAQQLSSLGVPVFLADVKGDLSGLALPGGDNAKVSERLKSLALTLDYAACPVTFWDVFGEAGHPVRATISDMGPLLLARLLELNDTQEGVLNLVFRVADEAGLLLLDIKDLRAMLQFVGDNAAKLKTEYGNVSASSIGAIQRGVLALESQGAEHFFGEPMLDVSDLMQTQDGKGVINILAADKLVRSPKLYATFLLWMLAELFEQLPEVGDLPQPKLVFFFDEAHLLFTDAPKALLEKIEQVVRLIRSKGVGIYFVTQSPSDIPESVLGQLGNRVQHALRAFTPQDQKAVKAAAQTMRPNPGLSIIDAITELAVGEALVSFLDAEGRPTMTERAFIVPPGSHIGPLTAEQRRQRIAASSLAGHYEQALDRESAYEQLRARGPAATPAAKESPSPLNEMLFGKVGPRGGVHDGLVQTLAKSAARTVGSSVGREIVRGVLGSLFGKRR